MGQKEKFGQKREVSPGVWRVSVEANKDATGKRKRKSATCHGTAKDADDMITALYLQHNSKSVPGNSGSDMTVRNYFEQIYLADMEQLVEAGMMAPSTVQSYKAKIALYISPSPFGDTPLCDLSVRAIKHHFQTLSTTPGAIKTAWIVFRAGINYAINDCEMLDRNPLPKRIRLPEVDAYIPDVLTLDELTRMLEAFRDHPLEPWLLISATTGLRRAESCGLWWRDINLETGQITIDKGLQYVDHKVIECKTKTKHSKRCVVLPDFALVRLREIVANDERLQGLYQVQPLVPDRIAHLKRRNPEGVAGAYRSACKKLGVKWIPPKNLRHTFATLVKASGEDPITIAKTLGHSGLGMLYNHYAQGQEQMARQAAGAFDRLIER
jgi:integrase